MLSNPFAQLVFDVPLCYQHVIAMSFRKIRGKFHQLVFSEVCLKHAPKRYLSVGANLFEVSPFLVAFCRFLFQANSTWCVDSGEIHQNVKTEIKWNKVHQ